MIRYVISCEHATAHVPAAFGEAFAGAEKVLASHRGSDMGALQLAEQFSQELQEPCYAAEVTRLLVDTNRSSHHRAVYSQWSRQLTAQQREQALASYWRPHRDRVQAAIQKHIERGRVVLHIGVHSFTPCFEGEVREIDVAWLYYPARPLERLRAAGWQRALASLQPGLRLRKNVPYRGTSDGLTTYLRTQFPAEHYLGIELEVSQQFPLGDAAVWHGLRQDICASFLASR